MSLYPLGWRIAKDVIGNIEPIRKPVGQIFVTEDVCLGRGQQDCNDAKVEQNRAGPLPFNAADCCKKIALQTSSIQTNGAGATFRISSEIAIALNDIDARTRIRRDPLVLRSIRAIVVPKGAAPRSAGKQVSP